MLTGWLANPRLAAESEACGIGFPIPETEIVCGLLPALSVIVTEPKRLPDAVGVNVTLMVQLVPAATLVGQLLSCAKSPVGDTLVMTKAALPVLVKVTDCAALVVPMDWPPKVNVLVE